MQFWEGRRTLRSSFQWVKQSIAGTSKLFWPRSHFGVPEHSISHRLGGENKCMWSQWEETADKSRVTRRRWKNLVTQSRSLSPIIRLNSQYMQPSSIQSPLWQTCCMLHITLQMVGNCIVTIVAAAPDAEILTRDTWVGQEQTQKGWTWFSLSSPLPEPEGPNLGLKKPKTGPEGRGQGYPVAASPGHDRWWRV